jgi:sensor histidine kinase YesM
MHPIFARGERLALYLATWLLVGVLLATVLTPQGLSWIESFGFLLPVLVVYAFVCLSAWYVCRATPLLSGRLVPALASSIAASVVASGLLTTLTLVWAAVMSAVPAFASAAVIYGDQLPFVFAAGVLLFLLALAVHYALIAFEAAQEAERGRLELAVLTRDAELRALRAQIDPHFLYNSLNSISAMTSMDPAGARRMCLMLGDFLRMTLDVGARAWIPLADELALADTFLGIEQVRFGARLQVLRHIDATALGCRVPPLLLQPLVENAVTHGIARTLQGGVIGVDVRRDNGRLSIAIDNPRDTDEPTAPRPQGVGLDNVRRRIDAVFGATARLEAGADADRFRVRLDLPWSGDD